MVNEQPEALRLADDRPTSLNDDLYQWAIDAEDKLRRLHESNIELLTTLEQLARSPYHQLSFRHKKLIDLALAAIAKAERTTP